MSDRTLAFIYCAVLCVVFGVLATGAIMSGNNTRKATRLRCANALRGTTTATDTLRIISAAPDCVAVLHDRPS